MKSVRTLAIALTVLVGACTRQVALRHEPEVDRPHLVALTPDQCRSLIGDDSSAPSLQNAVARSLEYLSRIPSERTWTALDRQVRAGSLYDLLSILQKNAADGDWSNRGCALATVYRGAAPDDMLVTGYYQPELAASRTQTRRFRYPLYREPDDLVEIDLSQWCPECGHRIVQGRVKDGHLIPYYSRQQIDAGALERRGYEIAWLEDPVEAFFMHVQGSAVLRFDDGVQMHASYSSSNGRSYTSIGRVLIERGQLTRENLSMQALKRYLRAHPEEQAEIMSTNERYIFFRTVTNGPIGSLGVPLTAGRSIAADAAVYPPGALVFMKIAPRPEAPEGASTARFALIQDSGIAISGPGRFDVFWGTGTTAEAIAGDMRNPGELYLVLPRESPSRDPR